ncbi:MAG TPA: hypothetical protein VEO75_00740 [Nitrososphaerales archaeon]|nr:hypothetical protein [Nitrososphaerales archaeon]
MAEKRGVSRNRVVTGVGVYEADDDWAKIADGWSFREVAGVATDSRSRAYVFSRSEHR